jgi:apolipoprotein N-acyltransferase
MNTPTAEPAISAQTCVPARLSNASGSGNTSGFVPYAWPQIGLLMAGAVGSFHLAYAFSAFSFLMVVFLFALFELARVGSGRRALAIGLLTGLLVYGPQLAFFWTLFGPGAVTLWLVLAFWLGGFLVLLRQTQVRFGSVGAALLAPFLWTGLEYFRSEVYFLRFSWVNAGYAFFDSPQLPLLAKLGVYGVGFVLMALVSALSLLRRPVRLPVGGTLLIALAVGLQLPASPLSSSTGSFKEVRVAGVQLEFPNEREVLVALEALRQKHSAADIFMLSEYTFDGPIPEVIRAWCRKHQKHLVAGGKEPAADSNYFNTAFVVGPDGRLVFQQVKCRPIQFFKDGLPAREQKLWDSPWGKLGLCICYDLNYRQVTDELIRQGAQALLVPTMDVADWGENQHRLHARVAPVRAAEYGVPIFRLCSSGISQCVARDGQILAAAPYPGEGEMMAGTLRLALPGALPLDRVLVRVALAVTSVLVLGLCVLAARERFGLRSNDQRRLLGLPL